MLELDTNYSVNLVVKDGSSEDCLHNKQRFEDPQHWIDAGIAAVVHMALRIVSAGCLFILFLCKKLFVLDTGFILKFRYPLPLLSEVGKTKILWNIYDNNTRRPSPSREEQEYERLKDELQEQLAKQMTYSTISKILEAGLEAEFQFFFQAVYYFPTLVLAFMKISGAGDLKDMIDWKIVSIVFSFLSFSLTSYTIRY